MALSYCSRTIATSVAMSCLLVLATENPARAQRGSGGAMGSVSRAAVGISLSVAPRVQADRLTAAQRLSGLGRATPGEPFCIWSNASIGSYTFSASAVAGPGADVARPAKSLPYVVELSAALGVSQVATASDRTAPVSLTAETSAGCGSTSRPTKLLIVRQVESAAGQASMRSGTVLLLIAPD